MSALRLPDKGGCFAIIGEGLWLTYQDVGPAQFVETDRWVFPLVGDQQP